MYIKRVVLLIACAQIWAAPIQQPNDQEMHLDLLLAGSSLKINTRKLTTAYWKESAQRTIEQKINSSLNQNVAKNVIMFLGDGMSLPTVAAARIYFRGVSGTGLVFDKFPYVGLSKTWAVDSQVPDSANTATACLCGIKARYGTIGVVPEVSRSDCEAQANVSNHLLSIAYFSQLRNKKTGLVTTARVTHASPAGVYAHTADRNWESDTDILREYLDPSVCSDIATQLVFGETGKNLDVILGGGRVKFLPHNVEDEKGSYGERTDHVNLIDAWLNLRKGANASYVWNRHQLLSLDKSVDNLLGLFSSSHMDYNSRRNTALEPSLAEMTEAAIKILSRGENGYFLFVEGAKIDMGYHATQTRIALDETIEFSKAVQTAVDLTNEGDTLIVVTSDHSHTLSYGRYPTSKNNIFSFTGTGSDGIVHSTLSYANGSGYKAEVNGTRDGVSEDDYNEFHYRFPAVAPVASKTHGGDDVAIYAMGPWAHLLSGVLEQNVIPHVMSYASCVDMSEIRVPNMCGNRNSAESFTSSLVVIILLHLLI